MSPARSVQLTIQARLQEAVDHANSEHRLADLCREMPQRLDALVKVYEGDRLPK